MAKGLDLASRGPRVARVITLAILLGAAARLSPGAPDPGEAIYRKRCASCHGESGEGVEGKHRDPLAGDKSIAELARYIEKSMPEDQPGTCVGREAEEVARYLHDAFYSPIARARNQKARVELSRLTVRQYRNAVADLVGSFREPAPRSGERGLRGDYFNSVRPGRDDYFNPGQQGRDSALGRVDPEVRFDFGRSNPAPDKLGTQGFAARWGGLVEAPETGECEFIVRTDHSARLWVNDLARPL